MKYFDNPERMLLLLQQLADGLGVTMSLFALTLLISLPLGLVFALFRMSKIKLLRFPVWLFILIMRGTPLILQVFTVYFVLPQIFGMSFDRMKVKITVIVDLKVMGQHILPAVKGGTQFSFHRSILI